MGLWIVLLLVVGAFLLNRGAFGEHARGTVRRAMKPALLLGAIGFALGFFGPLVWAPDANQGPLLGIFITGPGGFVVGLAYGLLRELLAARSAHSR